jgi:hypothetical protein
MTEAGLSTGVPKRRLSIASKVGLLGAGLVAGIVVAGTVSAGAASSTGTPPTTTSAGSGGAESSPQGFSPGAFDFGSFQTGTIKTVGTNTITIATSSGTKTYQVTTDSHLIKNGKATLTDLKPADTVHFATTSANSSTIDFLIDGKAPTNSGGFGPGGFGRGEFSVATGTIKTVGTNTITITTSSGTKTYQVTTDSHLIKNGKATLTDLKPGDTVHFATTSANSSTIDFLIDGKAPTNSGGFGPGGLGRGYGPEGFGSRGYGQAAG